MNYCFDISSIPYGTGVSRYTANLGRALRLACLRRQVVAPPESLSFFGSSLRQQTILKSYATNSQIFPLPPKVMSFAFHALNLPIETFTGPIDVFHTWDWYLPQSKKAKTVITIHDLALFKYPNTAHPEIKAHHQQVMQRIKTLKPHIIAVSEATKTDLVNLFQIDPGDITVIYEALPEESKIHPPAGLPAQAGRPLKPYLLLVGTQEPRKNILRQIAAWRSVQKDFDLVLVGKSGWESIPDEPGLIKVGYQQDEPLARLYQGASLFMYCSLAEGFGLPILEAFYHRVPVLTSNCSSMEEIAGSSATLVNPLDVESIKTGILQGLKTTLEQKAQAQARLDEFSWEKAAKQTLDVYRKTVHI